MPRANPEATFTAAVHRHLPSTVHAEGMANPFRRGTPDKYYDGPSGDLWVEYKYWDTLPAVVDLLHDRSHHTLTTLQADWLRRRYLNGGNAIVILGCHEGGVIFEHCAWEVPQRKENLRILTRKDIAAWIAHTVCRPI